MIDLAMLGKHAADVLSLSHRRKEPSSWQEQMVSEYPGRAPKKQDAKWLLKVVQGDPRAAQALSGTQIQLGQPDFTSEVSRTWNNPRLGALGRLVGVPMAAFSAMQSGDFREAGGPYYNPLTDTVVQPWGGQATTLHELGHAMDFNKRQPSENPILRQIQGSLRDAYTFVPFPGKTLWQETQAWKKGKGALEHGAEKTRTAKKKIERLLGDYAAAKQPAHGSYIGATAGAGLGAAATAGLGYGMYKNKIPPSWLLALAPLLIGTGLGGAAGLTIGNMRKDKARQKAIEEYRARHTK